MVTENGKNKNHSATVKEECLLKSLFSIQLKTKKVAEP
jgi:hypothetical protein